MKFLIESVQEINRTTEVQGLSNSKSEEIILTVKLIGVGNTKSFSTQKIINTVFNRLKQIEYKDD